MSGFQIQTYPDEIELTAEQALVVSNIRALVGDGFNLDYDSPAFSDYTTRVFRDGTLYKFKDQDLNAWPVKVSVSGTDYTELTEPQVLNYKMLLFSSAAVNEPTFEMFFKTFRYSDQSILDAYTQALMLLSERSIPVAAIPENLVELQAAVVLLEGSLASSTGNITVIDGRTEFQKEGTGTGDLARLENLKKVMDKMMLEIRTHISLNLEGIRQE